MKKEDGQPTKQIRADVAAILRCKENYFSVMTGGGYIIPASMWKRVRRVALTLSPPKRGRGKK